MATRSRSSKDFMERINCRRLLQSPIPVAVPGDSPIVNLKQMNPSPLQDYRQVEEGNPSPDRGASKE